MEADAGPGPDTDQGATSPGRGSRYVPAILSALVPGLGQWRLGRRREALLLGLPVAAILTWAIAVVAPDPARATASLVTREALWLLIALQVAVLGWRLLAAGRALLDGRFGRLGRGDRLPVAILVLAIVAPQAWAVAVTNAARLAADQVFGDETATPGGAWEPSIAPTATPERTPGPTSTPSPTPLPARANVLVLGVDSGVGRSTYLTDTMIAASLDPVGGTVSLLSIPRDTVDVPLPDGTVFDGKLNTLVSYARRNPDRFPGSDGSGFDVLMGAVGTLLGIEIDLYATVNLGGLVRIVDTLGGIDVNVTRRLCDPNYQEYGFPNGFSIQAGPQHVDGLTALAYARIRRSSGESDFTRAARQQEVLSGIRDAIVEGRFLADPIGLLEAIGQTLTTNVPRELLPDLATWAVAVDRSDTYRAVIEHPFVAGATDHRGSVQIPDIPAIRALAAALFTPPGVRPDPAHLAPPPLPGTPGDDSAGACYPRPSPSLTPAPSLTPRPTEEPSPTPAPTKSPRPAPTKEPGPKPTLEPSPPPT